jgi:hypothetical protein
LSVLWRVTLPNTHIQYSPNIRHKTLNETLLNIHIQYSPNTRNKTLNETLPNTHIQYSPNTRHKTLNETLPNTLSGLWWVLDKYWISVFGKISLSVLWRVFC